MEVQAPGRTAEGLQVRSARRSAVVGRTVGAPSMHCFGRYSEQLGDFSGGEKILAIDDLHFRLPPTDYHI